LKKVSHFDPALPIPSPPTNQAELAVQNEIYRKLLVKQILAWLRVGEWVVGGGRRIRCALGGKCAAGIQIALDAALGTRKGYTTYG